MFRPHTIENLSADVFLSRESVIIIENKNEYRKPNRRGFQNIYNIVIRRNARRNDGRTPRKKRKKNTYYPLVSRDSHEHDYRARLGTISRQAFCVLVPREHDVTIRRLAIWLWCSDSFSSGPERHEKTRRKDKINKQTDVMCTRYTVPWYGCYRQDCRGAELFPTAERILNNAPIAFCRFNVVICSKKEIIFRFLHYLDLQ